MQKSVKKSFNFPPKISSKKLKIFDIFFERFLDRLYERFFDRYSDIFFDRFLWQKRIFDRCFGQIFKKISLKYFLIDFVFSWQFQTQNFSFFKNWMKNHETYHGMCKSMPFFSWKVWIPLIFSRQHKQVICTTRSPRDK